MAALTRRRWLALLPALAWGGLMLAACGGGDESPRGDREKRIASGSPGTLRVKKSTQIDCRVGERPDYFVPGLEDGPLALLGCARLGVSGKRLEFSGNLARIDGDSHLCINRAYQGRGSGFFIPTICKLDPPPQRFRVLGASPPGQAGVRGYAFVVWGTGPVSTSRVEARFGNDVGRAAVLKVESELARDFGERPFSLFVAELPLRAACGPITAETDNGNATQRIPPQPRMCDRA